MEQFQLYPSEEKISTDLFENGGSISISGTRFTMKRWQPRGLTNVGYPTLEAFVQYLDEIHEEKPDDSVLEKNEQEIGWLEDGKPFCRTMLEPVLKIFIPYQPRSFVGRSRMVESK